MNYKVLFPNDKSGNLFGIVNPNYRMDIYSYDKEYDYWNFNKNNFDNEIENDIIVLEFND